jgi:hypothetical protein
VGFRLVHTRSTLGPGRMNVGAFYMFWRVDCVGFGAGLHAQYPRSRAT